MKKYWFTITCLVLLASCTGLSGQKSGLSKFSAGFPVNYEEDSVGTYILPDPLSLNGKKIQDAKTWNNIRRPELLALFESLQFGKTPAVPRNLQFHVFDKGTPVFNGKAIRKQVTMFLTPDTTVHKVDVLIYLPAGVKTPVPVFLTISFGTNAAAANDPGVKSGMVWTKDGKRIQAQETTRPSLPGIEKFLAMGIGVATLYYGDIEPDFKGGYPYGIRKYYAHNDTPAPDEWGAVAAWSWGLSRVMDYFEKDKQIDPKRIALFGVSRLGKTVLWTGARDSRFKLVIASCSGEGGAALSRRNYGENLKHLTDTSRYFYQFAANYHSFASNVNKLPFDAHMLVALMAPRPLLLQTGDVDYWSDPKGEFLSALAAEPVYELFGETGPKSTSMPQANDTSLLLNTLGYYMHSGGHGTVPEDWDKYLLFLKKYL